VWRLAFRELIGQWRLTTLISFGLVLAALAYVSLLGTASATTTTLTGDVGKAWNTPYDLLARSPSEVSQLERTKGLVSPNFISSIDGGITENQLNAIRHTAHVSVAAPVAVVGYTSVDYDLSVPNLTKLLGPRQFAVVRVNQTTVAEKGLARYPSPPLYVIWAPGGVLTEGPGTSAQLSYDGKTFDCNETVQCDAGTISCATCVGPTGSLSSSPTTSLFFVFPMMIVGVDPAAEAKLAGIGKAMTSGHSLPSSLAPLSAVRYHGNATTQIPVIVSTKSFISETDEVQADVSSDSSALLSGSTPSTLTGWTSVYRSTKSVQSLYSKLLAVKSGLTPALGGSEVVIPGQVRYSEMSPTHLRANTVGTNPRELENPNCIGCESEDIPPDAYDTWYRSLVASTALPSRVGFGLGIVGKFNPSRIPGFNILAGGNLSAYAPPEALLSNGQSLEPTRNPAGFITDPPLILTNLAGARYFANSFSKGAGSAFISAIRIRVSGTHTPSNASQARLATVAQAIHEKTGLVVSLVKGSSALPIRVGLAKGKFGVPALTVTEYWGKEGAAITFLRGVNTESLVLFCLTLGVVLVLLGVVGQLAARRRRADFGLLRAIGWPLAQVVRLAVLEMAFLGAVIGFATSLVSIGVTRMVDPAIPILPQLAVVPLLMAMSVLAPLPEPGISFIIATIRGIPEGPPGGFPTPYPYFFPVPGF